MLRTFHSGAMTPPHVRRDNFSIHFFSCNLVSLNHENEDVCFQEFVLPITFIIMFKNKKKINVGGNLSLFGSKR